MPGGAQSEGTRGCIIGLDWHRISALASGMLFVDLAAHLLAGSFRHGLEVAFVVVDLGLTGATVHTGLARAVVLTGLGNAKALNLLVRMRGADAGRRESCEGRGGQCRPAKFRFQFASPQQAP